MNLSSFTIWMTGLPCSGKSTLSLVLKERLHGRDFSHVEIFDGDEVRSHLSSELGFSKKDRDTHVLRVGFLNHLLNRNGVPTITAVISPYRKIRRQVREQIENFVEVYVKCPVEECARRDVKGMYAKAFSGEIKNFTGVSDPYEEPENPDVVVETDQETVEESADKVFAVLEEYGYLEPSAYQYTPKEAEAIKSRLMELGYLD